MAARKRTPKAAATADLILDTAEDATLLDMLDRLLNKGVVLGGDVVLGVAGVRSRLLAAGGAVERDGSRDAGGQRPQTPSQPRTAHTAASPMKRRTRKPASRARKTTRKKTRKPAVLRWNPDKDDVQRSVIKLVLTLVELIRKLMERQAIRRMDDKTLTAAETEAVGDALMEIERTIREIGRQFQLSPEDLNLDLGTIKLL